MKEPHKMSRQEVREFQRNRLHGTFLREGLMVAFPLCFPGVTTMIPGDESRIAALDTDASGVVYGMTTGRASHLFVGMTHGATGAVVDLGTADGATGVAGLCCGPKLVVSAIQTDAGGCIATRPAQGWPFDLLQEWSFPPHPVTVQPPLVPGERVVGLARSASRETILAATESALFRIDNETGETTREAQVPSADGVTALGERFYGHAGDGVLWAWDTQNGLVTEAVRLPEGDWTTGPVWAAGDGATRCLSDAAGRLYRADLEQGAFVELGSRTPLPVTALVQAPDGRLYGSSGEGLQRLFRQDPVKNEVDDLGCAISVFQRRRYGLQFSCAAVGHDGRLFFGEDDDLGHLWIYMPACRAIPVTG